MGLTHYKKTVDCECGCDYGSCDRKNTFILRYNRSCDIGTLFVKRHSNEKESKFECLGSFNDNDLEAITEIINSPNRTEELEDGEYEELNKCW